MGPIKSDGELAMGRFTFFHPGELVPAEAISRLEGPGVKKDRDEWQTVWGCRSSLLRQDLIAKIPEIRGLYEKFSYTPLGGVREEGGERIEKTRELDSLLDDLIHIRLHRSEDLWQRNFSRTCPKLAGKYLDATWMHTPWLTTFVLTYLLDAELVLMFPGFWTLSAREKGSRPDYMQDLEWLRWVSPSLVRFLLVVFGGSMVSGLVFLVIGAIMASIGESGASRDLSGAEALSVIGVWLLFPPPPFSYVFTTRGSGTGLRVCGCSTIYATRWHRVNTTAKKLPGG